MAIGSLSLVYWFSSPLRRILDIIIIEPCSFDAGLQSGWGALRSILTRLKQKAPVFQFGNGLPIMLHLPCLAGKCFIWGLCAINSSFVWWQNPSNGSIYLQSRPGSFGHYSAVRTEHFSTRIFIKRASPVVICRIRWSPGPRKHLSRPTDLRVTWEWWRCEKPWR